MEDTIIGASMTDMSPAKAINGHNPGLAAPAAPTLLTQQVGAASQPGGGSRQPAAGPKRPARARTPEPAKGGPVRRFLASLHSPDTLGVLFYTTVLLIALAGGATAAEGWLGWWMPFNVAIVGAIEIGGVYLASMADARRRLGESAWAARIGSALVAVGAVALNWFGHAEHPIQAGVFAGFSAAGYAIWLIRAGQKRRDQLRADGKLAATPPVYGLIQWLTAPKLTRLAKRRALENPALGLHGSLAKATAESSAARRHRAIIRLVQGDMTKVFGGDYAELVVTIADPIRLAEEIERRTDWVGVAAVYAGRIDPSRLAAEVRKRKRGDRAETAQPGPRATADDRAPASPEPRGTARPATSGTARSATTATARLRASDRAADAARGGWWTTARSTFYTRDYAPTLDGEGREIGGADLAVGLGLDPGNARRARDEKLRPRYAEEVARGARSPRGSLPDAIAQRVVEARGDRAPDRADTTARTARPDRAESAQ